MAREPLQPAEIGRVRTTRIRQGVWRADAAYADSAGHKHRVRKSGRTESSARQALLAEIDERIELDTGGLVSARSLVKDAVDIYLDQRMDDARTGIGGASTRSIKAYRSLARNWIAPALGNLQVRHLTPGRLDQYFRTEVPPTRYSDVRKTMHTFVKWLIVQGALARDPLAPLPSYQRRNIGHRSKDREITAADVRAVLAAIDAWTGAARPGPTPSTVYRDLVLFIVGTACRPGEALAVRRQDIDLAYPVGDGVTKPVVHITGTVVYDRDHGGLYRQPHTKSGGAGDRTVVLPAFLVRMLRERMLATVPSESGAIFATRTGGWLSLNNINTRFRESILKDREVGEWFELRLLRSATGTVVAQASGAEIAASQMGNTREIAVAHYIHRSRLAPDSSRVIDEAWAGVVPTATSARP